MNDKSPKIFKNIHIERTPDALIIYVKRHTMNRRPKQSLVILFFLMTFVFSLFGMVLSPYDMEAIRAWSNLPFFGVVAYLLVYQVVRYLRIARYRLFLSPDLVEFTCGKHSQTCEKKLVNVELRRDGYDDDGFSLFTLWLILKGEEMPTLERLTKEEGQYLVKIISSYMQLGDALFYPAIEGEQDEERSKRQSI